MAASSRAYLVLYNVVQAVGWLACLVQVLRLVAQRKDAAAVYAGAGPLVRIFQGASLLEALHAATGLVRSDPLMALLQWVGRSHVLFVVLHQVTQVQESWFGPVMLGVWAMAEVARYPWYALTTVGKCPAWLTWLRYTMFIPLYPVGVVSEMGLLWLALPVLQADGRWSLRLPNELNLGFEYSVFIKVVLAVYPLLWWQLYSSLLRQRSKRLGKASKQQ